MSSRLKTARSELYTTNGLQEFLSNVDENEIVSSVLFDSEIHLSTRHVPLRVKMESEVIEDGYKFKIPQDFHQLTRVTLCQKLPKVSVKQEYKDEYRISWIPKTLFRIIISGNLMSGDSDEKGAPLTGRILDIWLENYCSYLGYEYKTLLNMIQGDTNWSTVLDEKQLSMPQPFLFTTNLRSNISSFKLCFADKKVYNFKYSLMRDVNNLIRIQRYVNDKWVNVDTDLSLLTFSGINPGDILKDPVELWGNFNIVTSKEIQDISRIHQTFLTQNQEIIVVDTKEDTINGKGDIVLPIEITGCIRNIFVLLQNIDSINDKNYFDYSTTSGETPIVEITQKYVDEKAFSYDSYHTSKLIPAEIGLRVPKLKGYHMISYCERGYMTFTDSNIDALKLKAKIIVKYDTKGSNCRLHVFVDTHRIIHYENGDINILKDQSPVAPIIERPGSPVGRRGNGVKK